MAHCQGALSKLLPLMETTLWTSDGMAFSCCLPSFTGPAQAVLAECLYSVTWHSELQTCLRYRHLQNQSLLPRDTTLFSFLSHQTEQQAGAFAGHLRGAIRMAIACTKAQGKRQDWQAVTRAEP